MKGMFKDAPRTFLATAGQELNSVEKKSRLNMIVGVAPRCFNSFGYIFCYPFINTFSDWSGEEDTANCRAVEAQAAREESP